MSEAAVVLPRNTVVRDYLELSKSRIVLMVLITTAAGFLAGAQHVNGILFLNALLGTAMVAAGTNALNQVIEREHDAKMFRTRARPIPSGRISARAGLIFSWGSVLLGTLYLGLTVNWLTALLGAFTFVTYIYVYTPLKRVSTANTVIGAVPGAIPPLMGWTAATGVLSVGGVVLFGILFLWQLPHFMAISWLYREDYARGGFAMLAVRDEDGARVARHAIYYSLALLAMSMAPIFLGMSGMLYLIGAVIAGMVLFDFALRFFFDRTARTARSLFMYSNLYLLTVMLLLVVSLRA